MQTGSGEQDDKKIKNAYKNQLKSTDQIKINLIKSPEVKTSSWSNI